MAIIPEDEYPGLVTPSSTEYPWGGAKNESSPGAFDGTPWEKALVNDLFGFLQALLQKGDITPSGNAETATVSQYFDALQAVFGQQVEFVELGGDFDAGQQVMCLRRGREVTIMGVGAELTHANSSSPNSSSGAIPERFRPTDFATGTFDTIYSDLNGWSESYGVFVNSQGLFSVSYGRSDGTRPNRTDSRRPPIARYAITGAV